MCAIAKVAEVAKVTTLLRVAGMDRFKCGADAVSGRNRDNGN
jgi:hypothetical protein